MDKVIIILGCCVLSFAAVAADKPDQILTFDGLGAVRIGMTVHEAEDALAVKFKPVGREDEPSCWYANRADHIDPGISYMIQDNKVVRIDIDDNELGK